MAQKRWHLLHHKRRSRSQPKPVLRALHPPRRFQRPIVKILFRLPRIPRGESGQQDCKGLQHLRASTSPQEQGLILRKSLFGHPSAQTFCACLHQPVQMRHRHLLTQPCRWGWHITNSAMQDTRVFSQIVLVWACLTSQVQKMILSRISTLRTCASLRMSLTPIDPGNPVHTFIAVLK